MENNKLAEIEKIIMKCDKDLKDCNDNEIIYIERSICLDNIKRILNMEIE